MPVRGAGRSLREAGRSLRGGGRSPRDAGLSGLRLGLAAAALLGCTALTGAAQSPAANDAGTYVSPGGTRLHLLLDKSNVGNEVSVGEMTFPPNTDSGDHTHGAIEMFYVISGALEHVVNGKSQLLEPGMAGYVRPPDKVRHKTGPAGAKVVVIWVPGEEAQHVASRWKREP